MDGASQHVSDAERLLELQRAAHLREGPPSARVRIERLERLNEMVRKRADAFAEAISADFGNRSRFETTLLETSVLLSSIRHARKNVRWWMEPSFQEVDIAFWPGTAWIRREPLGVIGIVSPWNYPLQLALSPLVDVIAAGSVVEVELHRSDDGSVWQPVEGSRLTLEAGTGTHHKGLGVGSTVSGATRGSGHVGYRHYRLTVTGGATVAAVRFSLHGSGTYRNPARIVHLYDYLLAGAARARARTTGPRLTAGHASASDGLIGPFRLAATDQVALRTTDAVLVDNVSGAELVGPVQPGAGFYLRAEQGVTSATVTMTVPGNPDGYGGRVLTGVARDESSSRYTPLALAIPADLVVDFEIDWS